MKRIILVLLTIYLALEAFPQSSAFGLGVILGNPTGFSGKLWTGEKSAIDASIGYHIGRINGLRLTADYLVHHWSFESEKDLIKVFFGAGAGLGFISDISLSLRAPAGAGYYFTLPAPRSICGNCAHPSDHWSGRCQFLDRRLSWCPLVFLDIGLCAYIYVYIFLTKSFIQ